MVQNCRFCAQGNFRRKTYLTIKVTPGVTYLEILESCFIFPLSAHVWYYTEIIASTNYVELFISRKLRIIVYSTLDLLLLMNCDGSIPILWPCYPRKAFQMEYDSCLQAYMLSEKFRSHVDTSFQGRHPHVNCSSSPVFVSRNIPYSYNRGFCPVPANWKYLEPNSYTNKPLPIGPISGSSLGHGTM